MYKEIKLCGVSLKIILNTQVLRDETQRIYNAIRGRKIISYQNMDELFDAERDHYNLYELYGTDAVAKPPHRLPEDKPLTLSHRAKLFAERCRFRLETKVVEAIEKIIDIDKVAP